MAAFKTVIVEKNGVRHDCTSEEQLKRFLAAGYKKAKPRKPEESEQENAQKEQASETNE